MAPLVIAATPTSSSYWSCYTTTSNGQTVTVIVTQTSVVDVTVQPSLGQPVASSSPWATASNEPSVASSWVSSPTGPSPSWSTPLTTSATPPAASSWNSPSFLTWASLDTTSFAKPASTPISTFVALSSAVANVTAAGANTAPSSTQATPSRSRAGVSIAVVVAVVALVLLLALVWAMYKMRKIRQYQQRQQATLPNVAAEPTSFGWSTPAPKKETGLGLVDTIKEKLGRTVSISRRMSFLNYRPPISSMPAPQTSSARQLENMAPSLPHQAWSSRKAAERSLKSEKHVYPEDGRRAMWKAHIRGIYKDGSGSSTGSGSRSRSGSQSGVFGSTTNLLGNKSKRPSTDDEYDLDEHGVANPRPLPRLLPQSKPRLQPKEPIVVSRPMRLPSGTTARFGGIDSMPPAPRTAPAPPVPSLPSTYLPPIEWEAGRSEMSQAPLPQGPRLHSSFSSSAPSSPQNQPAGQKLAGWVKRQMENCRPGAAPAPSSHGTTESVDPSAQRRRRDTEPDIYVRPDQSFMNV